MTPAEISVDRLELESGMVMVRARVIEKTKHQSMIEESTRSW